MRDENGERMAEGPTLRTTDQGGQTLVELVLEGEAVGRGTLKWQSAYGPFREAGIPEINDLWVRQEHRGFGLGTRIIAHIEDLARAAGASRIGIGFGLYADYGPAQRLYVRLGYVPDGRGISYRDEAVIPGERIPIDDYAILWLVKDL